MSYQMLMYFGIMITIVYLVYNIVPKKFKYIILLISSYIIYILTNGALTVFILMTSLSVYLISLWMEKYQNDFEKTKSTLSKEERKEYKKYINKRKKQCIIIGLLINIGLLFILKYFNFFTSSLNFLFDLFKLKINIPILKILMPLGLSFYTLQAISYLIDVYRCKYKPEKNFFKIALFLGYYPQLIEGPFSRYDTFGKQLCEPHEFNSQNMFEGLRLIVWGLIKKIVIADRMNIIVDEVFKNYNEYSGIIIVFAVILYTFQIYAEFSGIIDMVRGISKMYGIDMVENFKQPFFSKNVNEFWRRWHISLGAFLRDYVFYSVSLSKPITTISKKLRGKVSQFYESFIPIALALFAVWFINGLWHGASYKYILYGMYYYIIMMIGEITHHHCKKIINLDNKYYKVFQIIRTFIIINIGMLLFRANTINIFFDMLGSIFNSGKINLISNNIIDIYDFVIIIISIVILIIVDILKEKGIQFNNIINKQPFYLRYAILIIGIFIVIIFGAYGAGYVPVDPIYGQF